MRLCICTADGCICFSVLTRTSAVCEGRRYVNVTRTSMLECIHTDMGITLHPTPRLQIMRKATAQRVKRALSWPALHAEVHTYLLRTQTYARAYPFCLQ